MEIELQFLYRGSRPLVVPTRLADLDLAGSQVAVLLDTYFDSESLALRRAGCTLRVRQSDAAVRPRLTFKGPSSQRANGNGKGRHETELEIETLPNDEDATRRLLRELELDALIRRVCDLEDLVFQPIGELRNRRSHHRYDHGLHRLDLTWDELEFPTGPPQTRLEVEVRSEPAERLLEQAAAELDALFGDELVAPERGKARELCERLYPELLAA